MHNLLSSSSKGHFFCLWEMPKVHPSDHLVLYSNPKSYLITKCPNFPQDLPPKYFFSNLGVNASLVPPVCYACDCSILMLQSEITQNCRSWAFGISHTPITFMNCTNISRLDGMQWASVPLKIIFSLTINFCEAYLFAKTFPPGISPPPPILYSTSASVFGIVVFFSSIFTLVCAGYWVTARAVFAGLVVT